MGEVQVLQIHFHRAPVPGGVLGVLVEGRLVVELLRRGVDGRRHADVVQCGHQLGMEVSHAQAVAQRDPGFAAVGVLHVHVVLAQVEVDLKAGAAAGDDPGADPVDSQRHPHVPPLRTLVAALDFDLAGHLEKEMQGICCVLPFGVIQDPFFHGYRLSSVALNGVHSTGAGCSSSVKLRTGPVNASCPSPILAEAHRNPL